MQSVRGQLEPPDASSKLGWRYIQCTDIPNECKVLLPPHTAQLYECLLAEESAAKQNSLQEEYEYLHRLKEHVIKKCLKLSRWKPSPLRSFVEIHAPDDFGSRELDAWGRETTKRTLQNCVDGNSVEGATNNSASSGGLMRRLSWGVRNALRSSDTNGKRPAYSKPLQRAPSQTSLNTGNIYSSPSQTTGTKDSKGNGSSKRPRSRSLLRKRNPNAPVQNADRLASSDNLVTYSPTYMRPTESPTNYQVQAGAPIGYNTQRPTDAQYFGVATSHTSEYFTLADIPPYSIYSTGGVINEHHIPPERQLIQHAGTTMSAASVNSRTSKGQSQLKSGTHAATQSHLGRFNTVPVYGAHSSNPSVPFSQKGPDESRGRKHHKKSPSFPEQPTVKPSPNQQFQQPYYSHYPYAVQPYTADPRVVNEKDAAKPVRKRRSRTFPEAKDNKRASTVEQASPTPLPPQVHRWIEEQAALVALQCANTSGGQSYSPVMEIQRASPIVARGSAIPPSPSNPQPFYSLNSVHRAACQSPIPSPDSPHPSDEIIDPITPGASQLSLSQSRGSRVSDPVIPDIAYLEIADLHERQRQRDLSTNLTHYPDSSVEDVTSVKVERNTEDKQLERKPSRGILVTSGSRPASRNSNRSVTFALSPQQDARNRVRECEAECRDAKEELDRAEIWRKHKPNEPEHGEQYRRAYDNFRDAREQLKAALDDYRQRYGGNTETENEEPYFNTKYV